ncbi:cytochrome P450 [Streptomyces sp. NK08204]|uniref:cytochrome P450 n=1 Tax=Streptomyces sp. NK08204 TaxID=2873260 RepID=UPI001CEDE679|nr:cytochrome P450 [Streptomyces sp. NK08204]
MTDAGTGASIGTPAAPAPGGVPIPFPQDRSCPYQPPAGYRPAVEDGPLARAVLYNGRTVWMVTGHAEARTLLADARLSSDRTQPAFPVSTARFAALNARRITLVGYDDPEHAAQRRMLIPSFTHKRTAQLRPKIQQTVDRLLDAMADKGGPADLVSAFALPLPSMVICELLGVPYEDHAFFEEQARKILRGATPADAADGREQLERYFGRLIDRKEHDRGDGLLDELIEQQLAQGSMDRAELAGFAWALLMAGHETTANMISLGTYTLLQHPQQLAELRADLSLVPAAVEELLRYLSVHDGALRLAVEDIEIAGRTIRAGDGVILATSLINRDPTVYPDPDRLDWHRPTRHHLSFGHGIHQCLGSNLARAELEIAFESLLTRFPGLQLAEDADRIPFKAGDTVQGMLSLPVTW